MVFLTLVGFDALYGKLNVCKELAGTYQQSWLTKREITSFSLQDSLAFTAHLLKVVFRLW